ncbi:MAG: phenylalanine--tRNA ligase subunit alpha [Bacteroidetes bacterium]|nr:phenylalanine--tRNA ligase subunit alpha [Bacteroidota bacterium]
MKTKIEDYLREIESYSANGADSLEQFRIRFLSKKGIIADLFDQFREVPGPQKKETGQLLNTLKNAVQTKIEQYREAFEQQVVTGDSNLDLSLPADFLEPGTRHPLSLIRSEIVKIFANIGFTVTEGPEIEDDWHNFSALNFPPEHPARDMQDTFFIESDPDIVLRTHTSSVQIRTMEKEKPPIRSIFPGRVFRNEAISARAHCIFHQVEGLYIDKNVSFTDLKQTLLYFSREMFGSNTQIRLRPSYFPFTEPSAEMDISCNICSGKGCNICKYTGWVEILGCGMVDPAVLENCHIDPQVYTGFAFGMGIERIAMLKYIVRDIRLYFENDLRFLRQFVAAS